MSAFYRLPVELLTIVAQYVTAEKGWFQEGKALRLTHPRFANLDYLNSHLFHNISFHATPEGIDRLKSNSWVELKTFVRRITFLPSEYSTGMTFFHFRRIVIKQCAFYCPADYGLIDHSTRWGPESIAHLESAWAKNPLFSPEELFASYQEYHKQAQAAQALLTDGSLQVWTDAIRQLTNVKTFDYGRHKEQGFRCEALGPPRLFKRENHGESDKRRSSHDLILIPHMYEELPCVHTPRKPVCGIIPDHPHDEEDFGLYDEDLRPYHPESVCALNAIRTQAALIEPISACIHNAGVQPENLIISSALTIFEPEHPIPPNLKGHLSGLRSFEWRARLFEDGTDWPKSPDELYIFLKALLHQCHLSLQSLRIVMWSAGWRGIGTDSPPTWPPKEIKHLPLPHLRQLDLKGGVNPRNLAPWISSLPRLENLTVNCGLDAPGGGFWDWRFALDAIRNHPSLLQVQLRLASEWPLERSCLVVAVHAFTRNSPRTEREIEMSYSDRWVNKFDLEKEGDSLCRWLEGEECEWNLRLDTFFPGGLPWE